MKILLVNTYDRGGAANACKRLHKALLSKGAKSKVLLLVKNNDWPQSFRFIPKPNLSSVSKVEKIKKKFLRFSNKFRPIDAKKNKDRNSEFLQVRNSHLELFSFPHSRYDITETALYNEADIINLHWVANFLDFPSFFEKTDKPVVWTLHDMNPFTGGEHYEEEFLGIDEKGLPLRRKYTDEEISIQRKNLQLKKDALTSVKNLTIVAPSKWLMVEAQKSEVFAKYPVHHIPYGLDPCIYIMHDKTFSRKVFNIPQNKKIVLFVADTVDDYRKGYVFLERAIKQIARNDLILCAIGNDNRKLESSGNLIKLGTIADERLMAIAYSAADVFVIPSLMDNLPNTVLESLMCGTPVIGFPVGGIKEMVQPGENGYLTKEISVNSLTETIEKFLSFEKEFDGSLIRESAIKKYDQHLQSASYIRLFQDLIG